MVARSISMRSLIRALAAAGGGGGASWAALGVLAAALGACNLVTGADELDVQRRDGDLGAECMDHDGDGYGRGCRLGSDCDDSNAVIHEGCDLSIDDGAGGGADTCTGGGEFACPDAGGCAPEATETCASACGSTGTRSCDADGNWGPCTPPVEVCGNGVDDNCDGSVDEGCCTPGAACTTACGTQGVRDCSADTCTPPAEVCANGVDDDCDGLTDGLDPECPPPCVTGAAQCGGLQAGHGWCNDANAPGNTDGSHCAPGYNTGGCDPTAFQGWCRSNDPIYWNQWVYHEMILPLVSSGCTLACTGGVGDVCKVPHPYWWYSCAESCGANRYCTTPLVVSLDPGAPVAFRSTEHSFSLSTADAARYDWPTPATPWLVLDRNGNGRIDDGGELFGSATRLADARTATNGFEALAELDENHDGIVDAADAAGWTRLGLWADDDNDGASSQSELRSLDSYGIESIEVRYHLEVRCDERGNCERERARIHWRDSSGQLRAGAIIDVYLRSRPAECE